MSILYLDCFSGASGDMLLGALVEVGVPLGAIRQALGSLAIDPADVWTERVVRTGVSATKFCVRGEDPPPATAAVPAHEPEAHGHEAHAHGHEEAHEHPHADHGHGHGQAHTHAHSHAHDRHDHDHDAGPDAGARHGHEHSHRTLPEIYRLIDRSHLSPSARDRAKALFARLGDAEAAIHGTSPDRVHLHEVGALDSIIDVVGAVFAMEWLGADEVVASPLNVGSGTVRAAHGLYPVPAPATLHLLAGAPIYAGPQRAEMVTPTGALLVTAFAHRFGPVPEMRLRAVGYGAGSRDLPETPNVLRVLLGDAATASPAAGATDMAGQTVTVIECEIDDMNPQIFGTVMDRLLAAGALDVFYTAVQMKKNRPGTLLTVVAPPSSRETLVALIFRETTTIGVRHREMARECLAREERRVETPLGAVRVKVARRGGEVVNVAPEYDDLVRVAEAHGRPVKEAQALVLKAYWDAEVPRA